DMLTIEPVSSDRSAARASVVTTTRIRTRGCRARGGELLWIGSTATKRPTAVRSFRTLFRLLSRAKLEHGAVEGNRVSVGVGSRQRKLIRRIRARRAHADGRACRAAGENHARRERKTAARGESRVERFGEKAGRRAVELLRQG